MTISCSSSKCSKRRREGTVEDATLRAMLQQEASCYSARNCSSTAAIVKRLSTTNNTPSQPHHHHHHQQQDFCHAVRVLHDIFHLLSLQHHETLVIAASYLSRYTSSSLERPPTSAKLPLAALVCFYMAVKVHESAAIPLRSVGDLYVRFFASKDDAVTLARLEQLELNICQVLQWRLHPPTPLGFVRRLIAVSDGVDGVDNAAAKVVLEQGFSANPWAYCRQHQASTLAKAALVLTSGDDDRYDGELRRAVTFLRACRSSSSTVRPIIKQEMPLLSPPSPPLPTTTKTATRASKQQQHQRHANKRCVSPILSPGCDGGYLNEHENRRCHNPKRRRKEHGSLVVGYAYGITSTTTPVSLWGGRPMSAFSTTTITANTLKRTLRSPRSALSMESEVA